MDVAGKSVFLSGPADWPDRNEAVRRLKRVRRDILALDAKAGTVDMLRIRVWAPTRPVDDEEGATHVEPLLRLVDMLTCCTLNYDRCPQAGPGARPSFRYEPYYDLLVRLPGWEDDGRCVVESRVARAVGIPECELRDVEGVATV